MGFVTVAKEDICGHSSEAVTDRQARPSKVLDSEDKRIARSER